jgi:DNA-binding NarL/FixJ family response regulator
VRHALFHLLAVTRRRAATGVSDPVVAAVLARAATSREGGRIRRAPTQPPIRIIIVDSQRVVLLGLKALLGAARNCEVIADATTAELAVQHSRALQPEVVVMDADLPGGSGIIAAQRIHAENPRVQVIMFGSVADPNLIIAAMRAAVSGYLLKRADPPRLVEAVELVAGGAVYFEEATIAAVLEWFRAGQPAGDALMRLSQQERNIVRLIADGKTNRDIAEALRLKESTVKTYVSTALRKLGLTSRAEAAAFVIRRESGTPPR